jgi:hypothetical protein
MVLDRPHAFLQRGVLHREAEDATVGAFLLLGPAVDQVVVVLISQRPERARRIGAMDALAFFHRPPLPRGQRLARMEVDAPRPAIVIVDRHPDVTSQRMIAKRRDQREPGEQPLGDAPVIGIGFAVTAAVQRQAERGRNAERFDFLRARGVLLHPQDGSGITRASQILVTSAAVEETVPDVQAARRIGAAVTTRASLLAELFNSAALGVGVAGTSGKSTTVGMLGWILHRAGKNPTIMNGADMKNYIGVGSPFASARIGEGELFVSELDESELDYAFRAPRRSREQHLLGP